MVMGSWPLPIPRRRNPNAFKPLFQAIFFVNRADVESQMQNAFQQCRLSLDTCYIKTYRVSGLTFVSFIGHSQSIDNKEQMGHQLQSLVVRRESQRLECEHYAWPLKEDLI